MSIDTPKPTLRSHWHELVWRLHYKIGIPKSVVGFLLEQDREGFWLDADNDVLDDVLEAIAHWAELLAYTAASVDRRLDLEWSLLQALSGLDDLTDTNRARLVSFAKEVPSCLSLYIKCDERFSVEEREETFAALLADYQGRESRSDFDPSCYARVGGLPVILWLDEALGCDSPDFPALTRLLVEAAPEWGLRRAQ